MMRALKIILIVFVSIIVTLLGIRILIGHLSYDKSGIRKRLYGNGVSREEYIRQRDEACAHAYKLAADYGSYLMKLEGDVLPYTSYEPVITESKPLPADFDKESYEYKNNLCQNVTVDPVVESDLKITVLKINDENMLNLCYNTVGADMDCDIYCMYYVSAFRGRLLFNIADDLINTGGSTDNLVIYEYDRNGAQYIYDKVDFDVLDSNDNIIVIDGDTLEFKPHYFVFATKPQKYLEYEYIDGPNFLVISPSIFRKDAKVIMVESDIDDENYNRLLDSAIYYLALWGKTEGVTEAFFNGTIIDFLDEYKDNIDITYVSPEEFKRKRARIEFLDNIFGGVIFCPFEITLFNGKFGLYNVYGLDDIVNGKYNPDDFSSISEKWNNLWTETLNNLAVQTRKYRMSRALNDSNPDDTNKYKSAMEFTLDDMFIFPNFGSEYSKGGNCAGISKYCSTLYNTGTFAATGDHVMQFGDIPGAELHWDLATLNNLTLLDRGLRDYMNSEFAQRIENNKVSGEERNFVRMIGAMWDEHNIESINKFAVCNYETINDLQIDVDGITNAIDNGRILNFNYIVVYNGENTDNVSYSSYDEGDDEEETKIRSAGHSTNLVGYKYYAPNVVDFYIYDNNNPDNFEILNVMWDVSGDGKKTYSVSHNPMMTSVCFDTRYWGDYSEIKILIHDGNGNYYTSTR